MIEKLTKEQEKKVPVYLNKWLKVGYRTKPIDKKKAKAAVNFLYDNMKGQKRPKYYVFLDSPLSCQLACNLIKSSKLDSTNLESNLESNLWSNLWSNQLEYFAIGGSSWWHSWLWHYDFILQELMPEKKKDFKLYTEFLKHSQEYHMVWLFPEICFISDFPKHILLNENKQLHSFDKPALHYRDGYSLFYSNGIQMKKEYITEEVTPDMYLKEENADMKAEMIKKVGLEKMLTALNPVKIDSMKTELGGKYDLLEIPFSTGQKHKFLKMKCPSTGKDHILGVDDSIKTASEAWSFLNNGVNLNEVTIESES